MSSGPVRRVSRQDIQLVQNLIERCLQLYMNQKEVVDTLLAQAKIEPGFTELVWQKLEEENQEFFKAYYLRLMVKHQIMEFNRLLEQQVQLMSQIHPAGVGSIPHSNGSHVSTLHQNSSCYPAERSGPNIKPENMHHQIGSGLPNSFNNGGFNNGGLSLRSNLHSSVDMSAQVNRIDARPNMVSTQSIGLMQGMNGGMIKSEVGYSGSSPSPYMFGADGNVLDQRPPIADASATSFSTVESTSQTLNESLLDADSSSFGFLGQIPRNFSLSDLAADFSHSSDILESYPRSPFLAIDNDNFLDSRERGENQGDNKRLDTISEGISYEDFGSE
ncbi:uncharacterized protein LOC123209008 [Mangifera indica]|uniref:uncharacterized protein LOC123209008 n=1 Tax=Mangifera indica TaxID=29780 RepID=UPI001CFB17CC|nr:uncharacterized protein LOC123209008 [Mangifera indica]XP_044482648.1 uncharacterized protein LOC123209008 [Mangifera indica]